MRQLHPEIGWGFVIKWIAAAAVGNVLMYFFLAVILRLIDQTDAVWLASPLLRLLVIVAIGAFAGAILGSAEAWPLVKYISHPPHWILATALGVAIGFGVKYLIPDSFLGDLTIGVAMGMCQWLVLRREVSEAGWWIPANMIAWPLKGSTIVLGVALWLLFRRTQATVSAESTTVPS